MDKPDSKDPSYQINYEPFMVLFLIKIFFSVLPALLSYISYYYKSIYLIENDEQIYRIRNTIKQKNSLQVNNANQISSPYRLINLKDPILNKRIYILK